MHQRRLLPLFMAAGILLAVVIIHTLAPADDQELVAEYSKNMGFTEGQVLDASISDNAIMKVTIDECSFCGAWKNEDSRNRIARSTLAWFLSKTGVTTGTVEWYNKARVNIMTISGNREHSQITAGMPCAIQKQ